MVRRGYPMVWKPASMTFLEQKETPQGRTQDVQIFDASGTAHFLRYFVTQTSNGWKISGVQLLDIADISV
jgi:putative heme degradation protein